MTSPAVTTFEALDAYLLERIAVHSDDFTDPQRQLTDDARQRALGKVTALCEVRVAIARMVADSALARLTAEPAKPDDLERTEAAADTGHDRRVAEAYTRQYGDGPMAPHQAEGR